jgi:Protein of unknown function (DUF433)
VIKGTRVTLRAVLASLAEGATTAAILADLPTLTEDDVRAASVRGNFRARRPAHRRSARQAVTIELDENLPEGCGRRTND